MGGHLGPFRWALGEDFAGGGAAHSLPSWGAWPYTLSVDMI